MSSGRALAAAAAFVLAALLFLGVQASFTGMFDGDAYYHLAVARHQAERGVGTPPPWARFGALADRYGDKELIFHLVLRPFARGADIEGGKWALAVMNGLVAAAVAAAAAHRLGPAAAALPLALLGLSFDYAARAFRLRPELLSLTLLLLAVELAARRRHAALGAVAALLALSHAGFHVLLVLAALWMLADRAAGDGWNWRPLAWVAAGIAAGVVAHPHFPANLHIWWLQFAVRPVLELPDKGGEFAATRAGDLLRQNAAWLVALGGAALLPASRGEAPAAGAVDRALLRRYAVAGAVFGFAWITDLPRYALWAVPCLTLAALHALHGRWRASGLRAVAAAAALLAATVLAVMQARALDAMLTAGGVRQEGRADAERAFAASVPPGAKVAATWAESEIYAFWAPQGRYLYQLDPVFLAGPDPERYRLTLRLFAGAEPDLPLALARLDSDHLALRRVRGRAILAQLADDPRLEPVTVGMDALYRLRRGANEGFLLDWQRVDGAAARPYPRLAAAGGGDVEGFVEAERTGPLDADGCARFASERILAAPVETELELAGFGETRIAIDGVAVPTPAGPQAAVLGRGARIPLRWAPGRHRIDVVTCRAGRSAGFYLVDRGGPPAAGR